MPHHAVIIFIENNPLCCSVNICLQDFLKLGYAEAVHRISMSYYAWNLPKRLWWVGEWVGLGLVEIKANSAKLS